MNPNEKYCQCCGKLLDPDTGYEIACENCWAYCVHAWEEDVKFLACGECMARQVLKECANE